MVVELHHRAKRILKKHLNSLNPWRPHLSASYFKWCDDPPKAFQSSHSSSSDYWSQFVLAVQNLSRYAVGILVTLVGKNPACRTGCRPWSCAAVCCQPWHGYCEESFRNTETIKEEACDEKVVEHTQSLWPVDDEYRMPEHAASYERIGEGRHCAELRNSAGLYA